MPDNRHSQAQVKHQAWRKRRTDKSKCYRWRAFRWYCRCNYCHPESDDGYRARRERAAMRYEEAA